MHHKDQWLIFVCLRWLFYFLPWELSPFFTTIWVRIFLEPFPTTEQAHLRKPGMKSSKRLMKCDFWQWWDWRSSAIWTISWLSPNGCHRSPPCDYPLNCCFSIPEIDGKPLPGYKKRLDRVGSSAFVGRFFVESKSKPRFVVVNSLYKWVNRPVAG